MKYVKHLLTFMLVCIVTMSSLAISTFAGTEDVNAKGKVTKVTVVSPNVNTLVMKKNSTYTIKTKIETEGKNADKRLSYSSSNNKIVSVNSDGKLKAVKGGKVTITVKSKAKPQIKDSFTVVVGNPVSKITLNKTSLSLVKGKSSTLKVTVAPTNAKLKDVTYSTSDKKIATVDKNGKITAVKVGKATITVTAKDGSGKSAKCQVTVKPVLVSKVTLDKQTAAIKIGGTVTLKATVTPSNAANKAVKFTTSDSTVATVDSNGKVTAKKVGKATITATAKDGSNKSAKCVVTVNPILVSKVSFGTVEKTLKRGEEFTLKATVAPSNATNKKIKYISSDDSIATVDASGKIKAVKVGSVIIKAIAQDGSNKYASCSVAVVPDDYYDPTDVFEYDLDNTENIEEDGPSIDDADEEYSLVWSDNFDGDVLDGDSWNVETHDAGWVNSEWQKYVNDDKNLFVQDGNLVIRPTRHKGENGDTFESGRVNTQGKHDFTYGLFEARVKVPEGQGFLPAFWMMPTNENLYGQWPRCGEIDCMEVMGQDTTKAYGTIHYGNPHKENQGTHILAEGNYADSYHVFACEWEPDKITWYVDGEEYYSTQNWYSQTIGQGKKAYPAPFDQNFYIILNLAVGGSWVGNPDSTTQINPAAFAIDYVKVYQKDSYDDNVTEPSKPEIIIEDKDEYVVNGDFSEQESLTDDEQWKFLTALGGEADATIENNEIKIVTANEGTADYSVQLVQAKMPLKEGQDYIVSFEAKADAARKMNFAVKAPDFSYFAHLSQDVNLTTDWNTYSYKVKLSDGYETDANCRVEFNMGKAGSTDTIHIRNVSYKKDSGSSGGVDDGKKKVLADGNLIYNGTFDEGNKRLGFWTVSDDTAVSVTSLTDGRMLKVNGTGVNISQDGLAVDESISEYLFSMDVVSSADSSISGSILGKEFNEILAEGQNAVRVQVQQSDIANDEVIINFPDGIEIKIDNVRLEENCKIKNGSFNGGTTGYEWYADSSASATFVVDSISEDNAADITVYDTGDADWKIQLKQNNVLLEKGKAYKLTLKAKSSIDRTIRAIMQGGEAKGWPVYSGENDLELTSSYTEFEKKFIMKSDTDSEAFLSICLGAVGGVRIKDQHRVCIDDISLVEIDPSELPAEPVIEPTAYDENLLVNADFENGTDNWVTQTVNEDSATVTDGKITYAITSLGAEQYSVELKQEGITLEAGEKYELRFKVESDINRMIAAKLQENGGSWAEYARTDISLKAGVTKNVYYGFTASKDDIAALFAIDMGSQFIGAAAGNITISDISLVKVHEFTPEEEPEEPDAPMIPEGVEILTNAGFEDGLAGWSEVIANWSSDVHADASSVVNSDSKSVEYTINDVGDADWNVQLKQEGLNLKAGKKYFGCVKLESSVDRTVKYGLMGTDNAWYAGQGVELKANTPKYVCFEYQMSVSDENGFIFVSMGELGDGHLASHKVTISEMTLIEEGTADEGVELEEDSLESEDSEMSIEEYLDEEESFEESELQPENDVIDEYEDITEESISEETEVTEYEDIIIE